MPKASLWAVCWALTTGGLCTAASWKPHNTVGETFGIWGNSGTESGSQVDIMPSHHSAASPWPLDSFGQAAEMQALPC